MREYTNNVICEFVFEKVMIERDNYECVLQVLARVCIRDPRIVQVFITSKNRSINKRIIHVH